MSGSSSTISKLGFAFSGMFRVRGSYAFQESLLQSALSLLLPQFRRRAEERQPAFVQDGHMVADFLDVCERMGREECRSTLGFFPKEQVLYLGARLGVEASHGLIEQVQLSPAQKAGR